VKKANFCDFCREIKVNKKFYTILRLLVKTNKEEYYWGLLDIIAKLDTYLFKIYSHLSPTQVILLRPDIFINFLNTLFDEKEIVIDFGFDFGKICEDCFEEYKLLVPER